ncbi:MAG: carboxypeptidase regulatory-like domain-containing protein [Acidobacteriales bacterium]|nr:carboxypeptidase regulatory-like domain-containing protein [Terriglobales bacterium]
MLFRRLLATFVVFSLPALACSCMGVGPACEEIFKSHVDAVFLGRVHHVASDVVKFFESPENVVTFKVIESYKGTPADAIQVRTATSGAACGFHFEVGQDYVVYAHENKGKLYASICSRTLPVKNVADELPYLRTYKSLPDTARIYGTVKRYTYDRKFVPKFRPSFDRKFVPKFRPSLMDHYRPPEEYYMAMAPMAGQKIKIEAPGDYKSSAIVNDKGEYEISGLRPGFYTVSVRFPSNLHSYRTSKEVEVSGRGCARVDFRASPKGKISGRITDLAGKPVKGIHVLLTYADEGDHAKEEFRRAYTNDDGSYKFEALPAAEYLIGINTVESWRNRGNVAPTFYPGVTNASEAKIIRLGDAEELTNYDLSVALNLKK